MVGVNAAVFLENIAHWCEHNQANNTNFHDGHYWTFNSMKAFEKLFPYIKSRGIRTALDKLKDTGLIVVGNYNKSPYDRTQWYALTEKAEALLYPDSSICQKRQIKTSDATNENVKNDAPIPDITTDVTSVVNSSVTYTPIVPDEGDPDTTPEDGEMDDRAEEQSSLFDAPTKPKNEPKHRASTVYTDDFEAFWDIYPLKLDKRTAFKAFRSALKRVTLDEIMAGARKYANDPNLPEPRFIKHASTWLNGDGWDNPPLPSSKPVSGQPNKARDRLNEQVDIVRRIQAMEQQGNIGYGLELGR